MSEFVQVESVNLEELRHALAEYPQIAFRFVGSRMKREGNRFRRRLIAERMSGLPGIKWGSKKKVGGNVRTKVSGTDLASLKLTAKGSRLLALHEYGATISGRPWLYIRTDKEGHGAGGFESSFSPKGAELRLQGPGDDSGPRAPGGDSGPPRLQEPVQFHDAGDAGEPERGPGACRARGIAAASQGCVQCDSEDSSVNGFYQRENHECEGGKIMSESGSSTEGAGNVKTITG
jgi:hypothetical protein